MVVFFYAFLVRVVLKIWVRSEIDIPLECAALEKQYEVGHTHIIEKCQYIEILNVVFCCSVHSTGMN